MKDFIINRITSLEGGQKYSKTLRKITLKNKVTVGLYSYGSCFDKEFNLGGTVSIGRYCSFAGNVRYFGGNHPMNFVSMSPFFYNKKWGGFDVKDIERGTLEIGNDVWIGYNVIITNKCKKIGNGAVIGAGTILTKDVPAYSIVVGNPGKVIRYRFDNDTIKIIEESKWWELEPKELMKCYDVIDNPKEFCKRIKDSSSYK